MNKEHISDSNQEILTKRNRLLFVAGIIVFVSFIGVLLMVRPAKPVPTFEEIAKEIETARLEYLRNPIGSEFELIKSRSRYRLENTLKVSDFEYLEELEVYSHNSVLNSHNIHIEIWRSDSGKVIRATVHDNKNSLFSREATLGTIDFFAFTPENRGSRVHMRRLKIRNF